MNIFKKLSLREKHKNSDIEKLRAFCEGLEMENIDELLTGTPDDFRNIGSIMSTRIKRKIKFG